MRRLGHEPAAYDEESGDADLSAFDAAVIEPGDERGLRLARALRARTCRCSSRASIPPESDVLALQPAAYLVKPFPLYALERALATALASAQQPVATAI